VTAGTLSAHLRTEWFLAVSAATSLAFVVSGDLLLGRLSDPLWLAFVFTWLFATILGSSLSVVRHAENLAVRLGEPVGTLILTLSITFIEVVSISAVMMHGERNPTLARDTLLAVVMIILNGMVGLSLLLGALRHREQLYNLQGANAYLGVIMPLAVLSLVLPSYSRTTPDPTLSPAQQAFLVPAAVGLYAVFLAIQTGRHRTYFAGAHEAAAGHSAPRSPRYGALGHAALLVLYLAPLVFLAEQFAHPVDFLVEELGAPAPVGGLIVAALVATPEAIGAVRAALANHLQRSVNIVLGSILSTIGLTVPAVVVVSRLLGHDIVLGVQPAEMMLLLLLTLATSVVTFASGRTNVVQGAVHLILFAAYLLFIAQG
jgi:Ca2+:H+ antiporter